jgi:predicted acyl esterase
MTKHFPRTTSRKAHTAAHAEPGVHVIFPHPQPFAVMAPEGDADQAPDQPFAEGAYDAVDPDLRHRMISEAAYRRYVERDYADGYDVDDWLQAEADVDHLLLNRVAPQTPNRER